MDKERVRHALAVAGAALLGAAALAVILYVAYYFVGWLVWEFAGF